MSGEIYAKEDGDPDEITLPTKFEVSLSGDDIEIVADEAEKETDEKDPKAKKDEDTDENVRAEDDKKKDSLLDQVDVRAKAWGNLCRHFPFGVSLTSHCHRGWTFGVSLAFAESSYSFWHWELPSHPGMGKTAPSDFFGVGSYEEFVQSACH